MLTTFFNMILSSITLTEACDVYEWSPNGRPLPTYSTGMIYELIKDHQPPVPCMVFPRYSSPQFRHSAHCPRQMPYKRSNVEMGDPNWSNLYIVQCYIRNSRSPVLWMSLLLELLERAISQGPMEPLSELVYRIWLHASDSFAETWTTSGAIGLASLNLSPMDKAK